MFTSLLIKLSVKSTVDVALQLLSIDRLSDLKLSEQT